MADELVLYTNPMSRGRIARWMLEEIGAPYRTEWIEYGPQMKGADFLAINPMAKVPALRNGSTVVTEAAAILAYLADTYPEAGLAPPPGRRGAYYRWLFFGAGPLEHAVTNKAFHFELTEQQRLMAGYGSLNLVLDTLEGLVSGTEFIATNRFTAADLYIAAHLGWGMQFGTVDKRPAFESYVERHFAREAYQRATALDDAAMPAMSE